MQSRDASRSTIKMNELVNASPAAFPPTAAPLQGGSGSGFIRMPSGRLLSKLARHADRLAKENPDTATLVVIDGKPAAGKSTLAGSLYKELHSRGCKVTLFDADWFLREREWRTSQMAVLQPLDGMDTLQFIPEEFHRSFWDWARFTEALEATMAAAEATAPPGRSRDLVLDKVYDRATGAATARQEIAVERGGIILLAGSYALSHVPLGEIGVSMLLSVNSEEGMRRKIRREEEKDRPPTQQRLDEVRWSWENIEDPTFDMHLATYYTSADVVVENSNPRAPSIRRWSLPK